MSSGPPPRVGDTVFVPGNMHGMVKFIGLVAGKRGTFAGVQLAPEYAARGKNSGDVDGRHYFQTTVAGSGIFLPIEKAVRMDKGAGAPPTSTPTSTPTPTAKTSGLTNFNQGGRATTPAAGGGRQKPNFSQSVGVGGNGLGLISPMAKGMGLGAAKRESLPRPMSPL